MVIYIEQMEGNNWRIYRAYALYVDHTHKEYQEVNRKYKPIGIKTDEWVHDAIQNREETIYLYDDTTKPWENKIYEAMYDKKHAEVLKKLDGYVKKT